MEDQATKREYCTTHVPGRSFGSGFFGSRGLLLVRRTDNEVQKCLYSAEPTSDKVQIGLLGRHGRMDWGMGLGSLGRRSKVSRAERVF
jgi:hypothetical protein